MEPRCMSKTGQGMPPNGSVGTGTQKKRMNCDILPFTNNNIFPTRNIRWKWLFPSFGGIRLHMMMMRFYLKIITWNCFVCAQTRYERCHSWSNHYVSSYVCRYNWKPESNGIVYFFSPSVFILPLCHSIFNIVLHTNSPVFFLCALGLRILGCAMLFFCFTKIYCLLKSFAVQQNVHRFLCFQKANSQFQGSTNCWDCFSQ